MLSDEMKNKAHEEILKHLISVMHGGQSPHVNIDPSPGVHSPEELHNMVLNKLASTPVPEDDMSPKGGYDPKLHADPRQPMKDDEDDTSRKGSYNPSKHKG